MTAILFDRLPLAAHMVQRVTRSRPSMTITAPAPRAHCVPYDVLSERNREEYVAQSAATVGGKPAAFRSLSSTAPAVAGKAQP